MELACGLPALKTHCRRVLLVVGVAFALAATGAFLISREPSGSFVLEVKLASTTSGTFQVYFETGAGLDEKQSQRVALFAAPTPIVYRIPLPSGSYSGFRLDPLDCPGSVFIASLAITGPPGAPPRKLDLARLVPANQIQSLTPENGGVTVTTTPSSDDSQLLLMLGEPLDLKSNSATVVARLCEISLLPLGLLILGTGVIAVMSRPHAEVGQSRPVAISSLQTWVTSWIGWTLAAFFVFEYLLFHQFTAEVHAAIFPRWNDQIQYLGEAYTAYEYSKTHGLIPGISHALTNLSAQGTLHDVYTLLIFSFTGASRTAALSLNILALIAWQAATSFMMARRNSSPALIWAAALLPLCLCSAWNGSPGSAIDFRLDYLALCTFGVAMTVGVLSDGFRSRRWSLLFGATVAVMLLTRFLSGAYLALIFIGLAVAVFCGSDRRPRMLNLGLSALTAFLLAGPVFWLNRATIWDYYWIGHFTGPESAIRNQNFGIGGSFLYLCRNFFSYHVGSFYWIVAAAVSGLLAAGAKFFPHPSPPLRRPGLYQWGSIFLCAPCLVFLFHAQKSEVVLGVFAPGLTLLVLALWSDLSRRCRMQWSSGVYAVAAIGAAGFFVSRQFQPLPSQLIASSQRAGEVADYLCQQFITGKTRTLYLGVDYTGNSPDAQVLRILCYERQHRWLPFNMTLPTGISEPTEELVMQRLESSDFVLLTEGLASGPWPYDHKLAVLRPALRAWCESHRKLVQRFEFDGRTLALYRRPD